MLKLNHLAHFDMKKIAFLMVFLPCLVIAQVGMQQHVVIDSTFGTPNPQRVAVGDIDGDTYPDILVGGAGKLAWHKNNDGFGNFSGTKTVEPNLFSFNSVAIADMDNDTFPDVVYSTWSGNQASVYWQKNLDGFGTFGPATQINTNTNYLMKLEVMDFDNDGDNDIVLNSFTNIILLRNNGTGTFTTTNLFGGNTSFHVTDVNGDNLMDVIYVAGYDLLAYKQNANGTFTLLEIMDSFAQTTRIYSGDVDGDGDIDIFTLFENGGGQRRVKWYQNTNSLGVFAANQVLITLPNLPVTNSNDDKKLQLVDFDGDGKKDILISESQNHKIAWYKNLTNTTFGNEQIISTNSLNVREVVADDMNGDNTFDIVSVSYDDGSVAWYQNISGIGTFSPAKMVSYYAHFVNHIDVGDINGDGTPDILSTSHADRKVAWYNNTNGLGDFSQPQQLISNTTNGTRNAYLRDMDGDGDLDALYTYFLDENVDVFNIRWRANNGNGVFTTETTIFSGAVDLFRIVPCDIDNDNDIDIVTVLNTTTLLLLKNNGNGTFAPQQVFTFPVGNLGYIIVEDVDGDGDLDVISSGSNKFAWYENTNGQGDLSVEHLIPLTNQSSRILNTADLDGDGDKDILFINRGPNRIGWFENTDGNGTFGPEIILATVTKPNSILAFDIDNDGDLDIVCDAEQGIRLRWLENNGDTTFTNTYEITNIIGRVNRMITHDMDADGDLDLVTCSSDDDKVAWFENLGVFRNVIQGTVRVDLNANGCTTADESVQNVLVTTSDGSHTFSTFTNENGEYTLYADEGTYTTSITTPLVNYASNPLEQTITFTAQNQTEIIDFCLEPSTLFDDVEVSMVPLNDARPGFEANYRLHIKNNGTNPISSEMVFTYNAVKFSFLNASSPTSSQTTNSLHFTVDNLLAFETNIIDVSFEVATLPTTTLGETVTFTATVVDNIEDTTPENNTITFNQIIVGAYDPNDIRVLEGPQIAIEDADDYLHYIIRFQNTGNYFAQNVKITNILDDQLDWTTFQPESSSHDNRIEIVDGSNVNFIFNAIYLPGITQDEAASQGFISYKIKPKADVVIGDIISNDAAIYFDFNPPIFTNTVTTEIVEFVLSQPSYVVNELTLYPNPTQNRFTISSTEPMEKVEVYNQLGQLVLSQNATNTIDISGLGKGVYMVRLFDTQNQFTVKKIIKE